MPALEVPDPPLADDVVALRAFTLEDVDWIVRACRDPEIPRYTTVPPDYQPEHARGWLDLHEGERERGEALALAITAATDGEPLGSIGLQNLEWEQRRGEIGYWMAPWGRRRGATARAVRLVAAHAFALGLERIRIPVYVDNLASQRVAEKAGCTREGVLRSYFLAQGVRHDCVLYSLLPSDRG